MPRAPHVCSDCTALVPAGAGPRCPEHAREPWAGPRTESAKRTGTRHFNQVVRPAVLVRDGGMCGVCEHAAAVEVHHVVSVAEGGTDDMSNLIAVCGPCHAKLGAATSPMRVAPSSPRRPGRGRRRRDGVPQVPRTSSAGPI